MPSFSISLQENFVLSTMKSEGFNYKLTEVDDHGISNNTSQHHSEQVISHTFTSVSQRDQKVYFTISASGFLISAFFNSWTIR